MATNSQPEPGRPHAWRARHPSYPNHLRRLPPENYEGEAIVHWILTTHDRKTGWLNPSTHQGLREVMLHTSARHPTACALYCLMPDHAHLLLINTHLATNQIRALKFFREHTNHQVLHKLGCHWQKQAYDHVLRPSECQRDAFENLTGYILENPVRAGLIEADRLPDYPYLGCLLPGYPNLSIWQDDYWPLFWRVVRTRQEESV